jgi:hypothetical protein
VAMDSVPRWEEHHLESRCLSSSPAANCYYDLEELTSLDVNFLTCKVKFLNEMTFKVLFLYTFVIFYMCALY